jgi:hypothetical protein
MAPQDSEKTVPTVDELHQAFALLASADSGSWPEWLGPSDADQLRLRIGLLATLLDIVPRSEIGRLDEAICVWVRRFPVGHPASARQLKEAVRGLWARLAGDADDGATRRNAERALAIVRSHPAYSGTLEAAEQVSDKVANHAGEQLCAVGLQKWFDRLERDPGWTYVRPIGFAGRAIKIDKLYVELFAVSDQDFKEGRRTLVDGGINTRPAVTADRCPVVSASTVLARIVERCVVLGDPGSGKSTLFQWIARAANRGEIPDYDLAIAVRLSSFAAAIVRRPTLSLVEFFFETLEAGAGDWSAAADWLRQAAERSGHCLLLLDGWDEVAPAQREAVATRIDTEERFFATLITTRPLSVPTEFQGRRKTDVYHLAGLTPRAMEELVRNLLQGLGRMDLNEAVLQRIAEPDLLEMAANPFLLGLLVCVLVDPNDEPLHTRADVYQQVVAWIGQQHEESKGRTGSLTGGHFAGLRSLAYWLLFDADHLRYVFQGQELADRLGIASPEPVMRSRLLNQIETDRDEHRFLHATFQEYFAAAHAATLGAMECDAVLDRAMRSASRLSVLEFAAGMDGLRPRCQAHSLKWLRERDRFGVMLLRIARLAAAGGWVADTREGAGRRVRDELWHEIEIKDAAELWQPAVEALAKLDAAELCRRAAERKALPLQKVLCIAQAVPIGIAAREGVLALLPAALREDLRGDDSAASSSRKRVANRALLRGGVKTSEERWKAIVFAGAARDREAVGDLIAILGDDISAPMLSQQALESLGRIGGRQAIDALVDVVTGKLPMVHEGVQLAVAALRYVANNEKVLDAVGRDTILRRLAMAPLEDPTLESSLSALEGRPLREGADLVAAIASDRRLSAAVRRKAVDVMRTAVHRRLVETLLRSIESEPDRDVMQALMNLADQRGIPLSAGWLARQIGATRDRLQRRRLLMALVRSVPRAPVDERRRAEAFLGRLIEEALASEESADTDELCKALVAASTTAEPGQRWHSSPRITAAARQVLDNFVKDTHAVSEGRFLLAVAVVDFFADALARETLQAALRGVLRLARTTQDAKRVRDRMAAAIGDALARLAPAELLAYGDDCQPVQATLRSWAIRLGWLVFDARIIDAEGGEVCRLGNSEEEPASVPESQELDAMLKVCKQAEKNAFAGYWSMVTEGGPCQTSDTYKTIYDALNSLLNARKEEIWNDEGKLRSKRPRGQSSGNTLEAKLPDFSNWVTYLKRARIRIEKELPSAIPRLRDLGLYRNRRR